MPNAPRYERQVSDAPFPNVRVGAAPTAETYGGQIGDTASNLGVRMYDLQTRSSDHAAVVEAETRANAEQLRIQQDMLGMKGKDASNAPQYVQEEWGKVHEEIIGSLSNDRQRAQYHQIGLQKGEILNRAALQHFNQEDEHFQQQTYKANLSSSVDVARANAESPTAVAFEKDLQTMRVDEHAATYGYAGTPQHAQEVTGMMSATNTAVVNGLVEKGQDLRAKAYYDSLMKQEKAQPTKLQFTAPDRDTVEKVLQEGSTRGESRRQASQILATKGIETPDQRRDAMKAVDGITNDNVADATRQRLEHAFTRFDQLKNEDQSRQFEVSAKVLDEQGLKRPNAMLEDLIPIPLLNTLDAKDRDALRLHLDRIRKPADHAHDPEVWFRLEGLTNKQLANVSPQVMMRDYLNHFDGSHYDRALTNWNAARNLQEKGDGDQKYVSALSDRERIKNGWIESKIAKDPNGKLSDEETIWFNRYETQADQALSKLPKDSTPEQKQKVINGVSDALLKQRYTVDPGLFRFNKQVPAIGLQDVKDARSIRIPLTDIPVDRQNALKGALRQAGVPITDQAMEELEAKSRMKKLGVK